MGLGCLEKGYQEICYALFMEELEVVFMVCEIGDQIEKSFQKRCFFIIEIDDYIYFLCNFDSKMAEMMVN